jgi:hypothetical protein
MRRCLPYAYHLLKSVRSTDDALSRFMKKIAAERVLGLRKEPDPSRASPLPTR